MKMIARNGSMLRDKWEYESYLVGWKPMEISDRPEKSDRDRLKDIARKISSECETLDLLRARMEQIGDGPFKHFQEKVEPHFLERIAGLNSVYSEIQRRLQ